MVSSAAGSTRAGRDTTLLGCCAGCGAVLMVVKGSRISTPRRVPMFPARARVPARSPASGTFRSARSGGGRLVAHGGRHHDRVRAVLVAVPVVAGDQHQATVAAEPEDVLGIPGELLGGVDLGPLHGVPDPARVRAHPYGVADDQLVEVVEGAATGVHGVAGDHGRAVLRTDRATLLPPAEDLRVGRRQQRPALPADRLDLR